MVARTDAEIDNSHFLKKTEYPGRDAIYNWLVKKYERKGKHWKKSDSAVFGGFLYYVWDFVPSLLFIWFTWWLVMLSYDHYGEFHAFVTLGIMLLFRLNALLRQVTMTNRLLKG